MVFSESQFFDYMDVFDEKTTEELLMLFKRRYIKALHADMYDFVESMTVRDAVLLLSIVLRFMDSLEWRI